ncbi:MAG TPA: hypothetical protein VIC25_09970 [Caulobacteraceae bacterium]|jgi:hypothetical protein
MTDAERKRRSPPKRIASIRSPAPTAAAPLPPTPEVAVSEAVARVIRLGYQVLAQNLEEGRAAAEQFRTGDYSLRNMPGDINQMAQRFTGLGRELTATAFDIVDRLLQDPGTAAALQRWAATQTTSRTSAVAQAPSATAKPSNPPPSKAPDRVTVNCRFTGGGTAQLKAALLPKPLSATLLACTPLAASDSKVPAITGVTFEAGSDNSGVTAVIPLSKDQPAGLYSGAILDAGSGLALGSVTIQVR